MTPEENTLLMQKYSEEILEVIDCRDDFARGDLQGAIEAIVLNILSERK